MNATTTQASAPANQSGLLDIRSVAALLNCSTRHVYRLADSGLMPPPLRIGALVRWDRRAIEAWIADGCPRVVSSGKGARQ